MIGAEIFVSHKGMLHRIKGKQFFPLICKQKNDQIPTVIYEGCILLLFNSASFHGYEGIFGNDDYITNTIRIQILQTSFSIHFQMTVIL